MYAIFPSKMKSMLKKLELVNDSQLRSGGLIFAVIGIIILKILNKDIYRLLPPLILPNTGNMGMPLCLFAYGKMGLAIATAATAMILVFHFSVGWDPKCRALTDGNDQVLEKITVFPGLGEKFFNLVAVAVVEFTADAVGEQAADDVLSDIVLARSEQMNFQLRHTLDVRAVRDPGSGLHFLRIDALEVLGVASEIIV